MTRTQYLCFLLVEDPSDEFTRIRDFVDAKNCLKLGSFSKEKLHQGFSAEMIEEAQRELKINKVSVCFFFSENLEAIIYIFVHLHLETSKESLWNPSLPGD